jgi:poly(beta-D-mannuronate) lyase
VTLSGFVLPGVRITDSNHCRVTRCRVQSITGNGISVDGKSDWARIDHCDIGDGNTTGDVVHPGGFSTNTLIDHNHFHDLHAPHTITMGCCGATYDYHDTGDVAEYNLFTNCMSGAELFSVKSSKSTIRYNTVRNCAGDIDIRAGRNDVIQGNFVFNMTGNFGIRLYEDGHHIFNNYVESPRPIAVGPWHDGHAQVKNATIAFNTFVGRVALGDDIATTFVNNIVIGNVTFSAGFGGTMPIMPVYRDNILFMGTGPTTGFTMVDPKLVRKGDVLALTAGSPAIGKATNDLPFITDDMRGTTRGAKSDIGAEQLSASPGPRRPLTTADVGPDAP